MVKYDFQIKRKAYTDFNEQYMLSKKNKKICLNPILLIDEHGASIYFLD